MTNAPRKSVHKMAHLDKTSKHYRPLHEPAFIRKWFVQLTEMEPLALSLMRPFDLNNFEPVVRKVVTIQERNLFNYFRVVISSEDQNFRLKGIARGTEWMAFDKVSGAFLGLWATSDAALPYHPFSKWAGGKVGVDCMGQGANTMQYVVALKRCLPHWDFGPLTGGKLIALLATSKEVLELHEMQYSLPLCAMVIKTQKGKSSQYNRLHPRGIEWQGEAPDGAGIYITQLRKNAKDFLLEKSTDPGKPMAYTMADQVDYWKSRWLPNKIALAPGGIVKPDLGRYMLSSTLRDRMDQRIEKERARGRPSEVEEEAVAD